MYQQYETMQGKVRLFMDWRFGMKRLLIAALLLCSAQAQQPADASKQLEGFDDYMAKVLKDWNAPGIGVGIVVGDKLVFAKGYGYRDYGKKLPFTPGTVC